MIASLQASQIKNTLRESEKRKHRERERERERERDGRKTKPNKLKRSGVLHFIDLFLQFSFLEGCAVQTLRDHALVKRDAEADPSLLYAPAYYNAYNPYYYNPYYYARVAQLAPVVATVNKPVTYTHLGAHPLVNPSTVVEQESHIVGHAFV
jgi:hypothetical protein